MNKQTQVFSVKIVGILCIIYAIPFLRTIADAFAIRNTQFFENKTDQAQMFAFAIASSITPVVLLSLLGTLLIIYSEKIVLFISHDCRETEEKTDIKNIQSVAFSIIGVALVAFSIPDISHTILYYHFLSKAGDQLPIQSVPIISWANLGAGIIKLLIGIALFWGSKGFTSLWYFFQKARPMSKINMGT